MIPGSKISHETALGVRLSFPEVKRDSIVEHDITLLRPGTVVRLPLPISGTCRMAPAVRGRSRAAGLVASFFSVRCMVSGFTITSAVRQPLHERDSQAQSHRSASPGA